MKRYLPLFANIISQMIFGFAYLFLKMGMAVVDQDTVKFLSFRFGLGFIALSLILLLGIRKASYRGRPVRLIILCGLFNPMISQILETTSTTYAPTSQIAMYNSLLPVIMLLFSALINHEYPTRRQLMFVVLTTIGVFITTLADKSETGLTSLGLILIIGTIISVSLNRVLVRRASGEFSSFEIVYVTTAMGAAFFNAISMGKHMMMEPLSTYLSGLSDPRFLVSLIYMGIGSCVIAFLLMTYASANLPFAVFSSTSTLSTVVGILSGVFLMHETFRPVEALGVAVILIGIIGVSLSYDKNDASGNRFHKASEIS